MRNLLLILLTFLPFVSLANDKISLDSLDRVLNNRDHYLSAKQRAIANAESKLSMASNPNDQLKALQELYNQYYTFRFDSAMVKVEKMHQLAHQSDRKDYQALSDTYKAELLATTGLFHEALQTLEGVNRSDVADEHLTDYYKVYEWTYSMLAEYAEGSNYADQYYQKEMAYQDSILSTLTPETALYNYWMAENLYRKGMFERAARYYKKAQGSASPGTRLYSQVTFGLALCATQLDNPNDRRNYLIMAAIGDQICPLKENLALQTLALDLASEDKDNLAQANKYLRYSLEDAMFFNDRLRLMEISRKVPDIVHNYEKGLESSNSTKTAFLWVCIIATLLLLAATIFGFSERNKLKRSQQKLDASYSKLSEAKAQLEESHTQLVDTHAELKGQKKLKEDCIRLFMDITAAYIYKLNMFHMTVQRKIKANQAQDLLRYTNPSRMNEAEAREFFNNFDHTFLMAFPNFIDKVNALLQPEHKITLPQGELNLDLRILALIRLGIRDSSKIAILLNLSPQTIYNHRSSIKSKAIDRDSFEAMVEEIM